MKRSMLSLILLGVITGLISNPVQASKKCADLVDDSQSSALQLFNNFLATVVSTDPYRWMKFDFNVDSQQLNAIRADGREVMLVVKDYKHRGEDKVVIGYIYDITLSGTKIEPKGSSLKTIKNSHDIHITVQKPVYYEDKSSGLSRIRSHGWLRKPRKNTFEVVSTDQILAAAYFHM